MPSSGQPISAAGFAVVTAVAILAHPRSIAGTKSIIFDCQLYIGPNPHNVLLGSLRYFNLTNQVFPQDPHVYQAHFTFARREPGIEVHASVPDHIPSDYDFVGDIEWLSPLGPPGPHYLVHPPDDATFDTLRPNVANTFDDSTSDDIYGDQNASEPREWPSFTIDLCQRPIVYAVGVATNCKRTAANPSFEIRVEQPYLSYYKDTTAAKESTPFLCTFADIGKYKNSKPMPYDNRIVAFYGRLSGVKHQMVSDEECVDYFKIDLQSIHFCGQYVVPATASTSSSVFTDQSSTGRSGKTLYALNTPLRGNLGSPKTPQTPSPNVHTSRKRGAENLGPLAEGSARKQSRIASESSTPSNQPA